MGGGFLAWVTVPCRALTDIFWRKCVPPDLECGWQGVLNSMDIHQSVLGCILTPRIAVNTLFLKISWKFPIQAKCELLRRNASRQSRRMRMTRCPLSSQHVHKGGEEPFKTPQ